MSKGNLEVCPIKEERLLLPDNTLSKHDHQILNDVARWKRYALGDDFHASVLFLLLKIPHEFKRDRRVSHLSRLVCANFFYRKQLIKRVDHQPHKRHFLVKLFKTELEFPFGAQPVLGIFVMFNLMKQRETFEEAHLLEALHQIIPNVSVVKGSFLDSQDKVNQIHSVYLEIERRDAPYFTLPEIKRLQETLPIELKGCIQQLVPVTFMRRNEEEVYRNILTLRDQIRSPKDIPQVAISFEEQTQFDLFFTVVLVRLIKNQMVPLFELLKRVHPGIFFVPDRVDMVGFVRKRYRKEANVFRLRIPKTPFFRKDRSVNLYKARQKVFSMLVQALGPIRDYNGGLIVKQNERLQDFLALMSIPTNYDEFVLENFFYSITPIAIQSLLPAQSVRDWFLAFSELLEKELGRDEAFLLLSRQIEETQIVIIKTEDPSCKEILLKEINKLNIPSLELAFSEIHMHGIFCFGLIYRPSLVVSNRNLDEIVKETMTRWSATITNRQILRLLVHNADPSLDPRIANGDQSYIILRMLFDGLVSRGVDGQPALAIAHAYHISDHNRTFTFYLRDSRWSNGTPITAYDFEYSWKKALNFNHHSIFSHAFEMIKNVKRFKKQEVSIDEVGIHAIDEKTLVIHLEYAAPYFLQVLSHWTYLLINREIDQINPGWAHQAGETFVCNGPFKLAEWKHSRTILVEKNPYYWDCQNVHLDKITISFSENISNETSFLSNGDIDILGRPMSVFQSQWLTQYHEEIESVSYPLNGIFILSLNAAAFPFNHRKIRKALALAIPRDQIAQLVPHEYGCDAYSLLPRPLILNQIPLFPNEDRKMAIQLFNEALQELKISKTDLPTIIISYFDGHNRDLLFQKICKQWGEIFDVEFALKPCAWEKHLENMMRGDYQIGGIELRARWNDPLHLLEFFEDKTADYNLSFWENPEYQEQLRKAKECLTMEQRDQYLKSAEKILSEAVPAIPLYELTGRYLKRKTLKNIVSHDDFQIDYKWSYKESK